MAASGQGDDADLSVVVFQNDPSLLTSKFMEKRKKSGLQHAI